MDENREITVGTDPIFLENGNTMQSIGETENKIIKTWVVSDNSNR